MPTLHVSPLSRLDETVAAVRARSLVTLINVGTSVVRPAGIAPERICLDPGIGFGKTHAHNLALMKACYRFHALGCPLLVGHSRKGFIGHVLGDKAADRDAGTFGAGLALAQQGVQVVRVHAVRPFCDALRLFEACGGLDHLPEST